MEQSDWLMLVIGPLNYMKLSCVINILDGNNIITVTDNKHISMSLVFRVILPTFMALLISVKLKILVFRGDTFKRYVIS